MDKFDNDIDDIVENLDFKPITKGLGFHHSLKEKKEVKVDLKRQSDSLKNELETRMSQLNIPESNSKTTVNMGELAPFYSDTSEKQESRIELELEKTEEIMPEEASMLARTGAWIIDFAILFSAMLVTFTAIIYFADLPMEVLNIVMVSDDLLLSFSVISMMFYVFYFSFFEKTNFSTPGKNILSIKVQALNGSVSIFQSFMRSILSLSSVLLLGLPILLRLHDKMTETIVVQKLK